MKLHMKLWNQKKIKTKIQNEDIKNTINNLANEYYDKWKEACSKEDYKEKKKKTQEIIKNFKNDMKKYKDVKNVSKNLFQSYKNGLARYTFSIKGKYVFFEFIDNSGIVIMQTKKLNNFLHSSGNGYGVYNWQNGDRYEGEYKDGKKDGYGVYNWQDGDRYEGEWKDGKKDGYGVYNWQNGDRYEGEWKDDKTHGYGVYNWQNGDRYEGEYKDGKNIKLIKLQIKEKTNQTWNIEPSETYDQDRVFIFKNEEQEHRVSVNKNKRLDTFLKQIGNNNFNCAKRVNFKNLNKEEKPDIYPIFTPGHVFAALKFCESNESDVNKKYTSILYDNGNLMNTEYKDTITNNTNVTYKKIAYKTNIQGCLELNLITEVGTNLTLILDKNNFVCRHLTKTIIEKLKEFKEESEGECIKESTRLNKNSIKSEILKKVQTKMDQYLGQENKVRAISPRIGYEK